ncbi:MAG: glycosyltransferase family 4 protein [Candidatus Moranbacteria bacterium]|nr:glycosyltransferase family 4 protein [Candidatus Moranbacteria bacterium]
MNKIIIIANLDTGQGMSGGTRIYFEFIKKISESIEIVFFGSRGTIRRIQRENVKDVTFVETDKHDISGLKILLDYFYHSVTRLFKGIWVSLRYSLNKEDHYYVYASSDFWADFFPALILHLRYRSITTLITPIYLFAPRPGTGYDGKQIFSIKLLLYYYTQQVMMFFARRYSDAIFVTYEPDAQRLRELGFTKQPHFVIVGGIEFSETAPYVEKREKEYDAVFVGRFHPQKGIYQLLDIWKLVVQSRPDAKLALIGNGDLDIGRYIADFIDRNNLKENIDTLGFLDGTMKYSLFSKTNVYLNTNLYDAGGMATMEAMSCGLPVVSFDFPNSRSMIGGGVLWAHYLDVQDFANNILMFLEDPEKARSFGLSAREDMKKYDWSVTARRMVGYFEKADRRTR